MQEQPDGRGHQDRPASRDDLRTPELEVREVHAAADEGSLDRAVVRLPEELREAAEQQHQAEGREDLAQRRRVDDALDHQLVEQHPEREQHQHRERQRDQRVEREQREEPEARVHPEHQELAVGEVHDVHDTEDHRQSDGDEGVDQSDQHPRGERLQQQLSSHLVAVG